MRCRVWPVCLGFFVAGCVPAEEAGILVANPFGAAPEPQLVRAGYTPPPSKDAEAARRLIAVGKRVLDANPDLCLHPQFATGGCPQPEVFHQGTRVVFVTEGLIQRCATDGQLAAVLCSELGKMAAERELLTLPETRVAHREPPPDVPVGVDHGGLAGSADGTHRVELGIYEKQRPRSGAEPPPPSPDVIARRCLEKTGYAADELAGVAPLLRLAETCSTLQKQMSPAPASSFVPNY